MNLYGKVVERRGKEEVIVMVDDTHERVSATVPPSLLIGMRTVVRLGADGFEVAEYRASGLVVRVEHPTKDSP